MAGLASGYIAWVGTRWVMDGGWECDGGWKVASDQPVSEVRGSAEGDSGGGLE